MIDNGFRQLFVSSVLGWERILEEKNSECCYCIVIVEDGGIEESGHSNARSYYIQSMAKSIWNLLRLSGTILSNYRKVHGKDTIHWG